MRVVDTSVLVDHLRGHQPATALLERWIGEAVPVVASECTRFELLTAVRSADRDEVEALCCALEWAPVTEDIARRAAGFAARYRGSHAGLDTADYLIAGTAALLGAEVVTTNVQHFPMFPDLQPPYSPEQPAQQ